MAGRSNFFDGGPYLAVECRIVRAGFDRLRPLGQIDLLLWQGTSRIVRPHPRHGSPRLHVITVGVFDPPEGVIAMRRPRYRDPAGRGPTAGDIV